MNASYKVVLKKDGEKYIYHVSCKDWSNLMEIILDRVETWFVESDRPFVDLISITRIEQ
jgi:hypothetical protein